MLASVLSTLLLQVFVGDMERWEDVSKASKDMNYIYFCYPVQAGLLEATTLCARAARDHGCARCTHLRAFSFVIQPVILSHLMLTSKEDA